MQSDDNPLSATCECTDGFAGLLCDTSEACFDDAAGAPIDCQNGGLCVPDTQGTAFSCDCSGTGFELDSTSGLCTAPIVDGPCGTASCQNGGTCMTSSTDPRGYECACVAGFRGDDCETPDPCGLAPCENGGSCADSSVDSRGYECTCVDGFTGADCEVVDFCYDTGAMASVDCMNSGLCVNGASDFSCNCLATAFTADPITGLCTVPSTADCGAAMPPASNNITEVANTGGTTAGNTITYACVSPFQTNDSLAVSCNGGTGAWTAYPDCTCDSHIVTYDLRSNLHTAPPIIGAFSHPIGVAATADFGTQLRDGTLRMRLSDNGSQAPGDGPANIVELFLPQEFEQPVFDAGAIVTDVDIMAGSPANECPLNTGTVSGTALSWAACSTGSGVDNTINQCFGPDVPRVDYMATATTCPDPGTVTVGPAGGAKATNVPTFADGSGAGCLNVTSVGEVTCNLAEFFCGAGWLVIGSNNQAGSWAQTLTNGAFSGSDLKTAMFRIGDPSTLFPAAGEWVGNVTGNVVPNATPAITTRTWEATVSSVDTCAPAPAPGTCP